MPPFPGEETLTTVYADAHIYFDAPTPRPILHRFDKSSYFYIYYNSTRQTSRIEVALHPGTPDQDAFNGFLENVKIINSYIFPTKVTCVVDGVAPPNASPSSARAGKDPGEWRLASADPRDPGTTKYRIHTIDFYFWVQEDAKLVVEILKRLLEPHQLDIDEAHGSQETHDAHGVQEDPAQHDIVSPVVQNLENVAISDSAYHKDNSHGSPPVTRAEAAHVASPPPDPQAQMSNPSPHPSANNVDRQASVGAKAHSPEYTPLAYNPAAPPAPEPIAHREDTPPPVDAADGTGLGTAAKHDHTYAYQPHSQVYGATLGPQPGGHYGQHGSSPQPSFGPHATTLPHGGSVSPHTTASPQPSFGPQAASSPRTSVSAHYNTTASADGSRHPSIAAQNYQPPVQDPNAHIFGQTPVQTPGTQFYSSLSGQPHKPLQHVQPEYPDYLAAGQAPAPLGGYSAYHYGQPQGQQPPHGAVPAGNPYDIHNQVYRPTEGEHNTHHHSKPARRTSSQHKPSQAERLEKGVGKLFKKIEKKIG